MRINNNIAALNTLRQYSSNTSSTNKAMEKLSSGLAINRAGDDAAGLAISEKMRSQIRGIERASDNSQNAISLVQTAEGALTETHSILQRMNELAVQASSDTNETIDRNALQAEFTQLKTEIDDIANQTKFNNRNILDGTYSAAYASTSKVNLQDAFVVEADTTAAAATIGLTVGGFNTTTAAATAGTGVTDLDAGINENITGLTQQAASAAGSNFNGTYYLLAEGSDINAVTFSLTDATGAVITTAAAVDLTGGGTDDIDFGNYGTLRLTTDTDIAIGELTGAFTGSNTSDGIYTISGGTDADTRNMATLNGVTFHEGDESITLAQGVTMDISSLTSTDWASSDTLTAALFGTATSGSVTVTQHAAETPLTIQTGANNGETLSININSMKTADLGLTSASVDTQDNAEAAITQVTHAINSVSTQRANLGAYQNRLEHKINNLDTSAENLQAAESNVRDVDMAEEMVEFTKNNILLQAAQSMLAQANSQPQGVLQLLQ